MADSDLQAIVNLLTEIRDVLKPSIGAEAPTFTGSPATVMPVDEFLRRRAELLGRKSKGA